MLDAYGLTRPGLADAREALYRVSPGSADQVWAALLRDAGLTGDETGETALQTVIHAMTRYEDPVIALCARALTIRVSSYQHLAATQQIVRSTP